MLEVSPDTLILSLVEDVAELLGIPATCFGVYLGDSCLCEIARGNATGQWRF